MISRAIFFERPFVIFRGFIFQKATPGNVSKAKFQRVRKFQKSSKNS